MKLAYLLLMIMCVACSAEKSATSKARPLAVAVINLQPALSYKVSRYYVGEIIPERASLLSFERTGKLVKLFVREGQQITKGKILAKLACSKLQAKRRELIAAKKIAEAKLQEMNNGPRLQEIKALRAQVRNLNKQFELSQQQHLRHVALRETDAISQEALDAVTSRLYSNNAQLEVSQRRLKLLLQGTRYERIAAQKAAIQQLEASLAQLEVDLRNGELRAPYSGVIAKRLVNEGTVVTPGQSVLRILESNNTKVHVGIPVRATKLFTQKQTYRIEIRGKQHLATIRTVLPEVDPLTKTATLVLKIKSRERFFPGEIVRLKTSKHIKAKGYWIPTSALVRGNYGLWFCFVVDKAHIQKNHVEILYTKNSSVFIQADLPTGTIIVKNGIHRVAPGQKVQILD